MYFFEFHYKITNINGQKIKHMTYCDQWNIKQNTKKKYIYRGYIFLKYEKFYYKKFTNWHKN